MAGAGEPRAGRLADAIDPSDLMQALYADNPDPILIVGADGRVRSANAAARCLFATESLTARPLEHFVISPDEKSDSVRLLRPNGSSAVCRHRRHALADGASLYVFRDVESGTSPFDLRSAHIVWAALQAITEGVAIYDEQEKLLAFNEAYERLCEIAGLTPRPGLSVRELIGDWLHLGGAPAGVDEAMIEIIIDRYMQEFREPTLRTRIMPFGDGRWMRVENIRTPSGAVVGIRADVTELREAEIALERQRFECKTLIEHIPDFLLRFAPDGTITFVNENFTRFRGSSAEAYLGHRVQEFLKGGEDDPLWLALTALTPTQPITRYEDRMKSINGEEIWIFWSSIAAFEDDHLLEYVAIGRDISMLKEQQQRIEEQARELKRKNDALNQFTGTVSHDLKAPLRHVSMFSEMMCEDIQRGEYASAPVYADHLRQAVRRMRKMIDSLLDYARVADAIVTPERLNLRQPVEEALINLASPIADAEAVIEIGELPDVIGDQALLARLCQNIIGNAVKYRRQDAAPYIRIRSGTGTKDMVQILFEDNGIGIEPRYAQKIFEVFQRLHRDESVYPGTGIGLALAQRVAESHRGTIELDTDYQGGTCFVLTLPALKTPVRQERTAGAQA
ncbi:ATP-binding protein [Rhizobium rhizosphaerae]|uniref:ATP-binding protein n=1 Tax=Xaviernesmea rhizosphaerae TaxID=1672749 RepID=UPI0015938DB9|nr:ATP-binding protein [Xaviernesmea rhizosphaerae]